jgi:2-keto-4-pentenoate hydratase
MDQAMVGAAAAFLASRRAPEAELGEAFPEELRPRTPDDVVAIQMATLALLGPIGGWKVGAHDPTAIPTGSPLPASGIVTSPAKMASRFRGAECEIGFRIGRDLPPQPQPYVEADILNAIESCCATIEIVSARFHNHPQLDALSLSADLSAHHGLCVGAPIQAWSPGMFASLAVTMTVDSGVHRQSVGSNPGGTDLLRLLVGLANSDVARAAGGIAAGAVITTGSWTGLSFVPAGARVVAAFAGFPPVTVEFA